MPTRRPDCVRSISTGLGLLAGLAMLTPAVTAEAAVGYVRSTVGQPWGQNVNEQAMDMAFGAGGWDDLRYETVNVGTLFSPAYTFLYLEGSDSNALELQAFLQANQPALEAWVDAGGDLFLNAAPNEGGMQNWGFGGVVLNYSNSSNDPGTAVDPMHPIWNGPFLPTALMWTGSAYAHASVSGPGLVSLIQDSVGDTQLAELPAFGSGRVLFGGLTTSNYWNPAAESLNLRANMISYLAGDDTDMDGLIDALDNCPEIANPMQEDADMDDLGDACDACPMDATNDADDDMACDSVDNCLGLPNPMQLDDDMDGAGNACDPCPGDPDDDLDGDTLCGDMDNCPAVVNVNQADDDMDGLGDLCDECPGDPINDPDEDGVCAIDDNCPDDANPDQADEDGDGMGDVCDDTMGTGESGDPMDTTGDTGMDEGTGDSGMADTGIGDDTGTPPTTGGGEETGIDITAGLSSGGGGPEVGGCACRTQPRGGAAWWLMVVAGLVVRRRRRRNAA